MTMLAPAIVVYLEGRCSLCDRTVQEDESAQVVRLSILGPAASVMLQCWLCEVCRPTATALSETTGRLLERLLGWCRATSSVCPTLRLLDNA
jgi:hypothetical protein